MKSITQKQHEILNFLRGFNEENGIMPSSREIQEHFGFGSQTAVIGHLNALERKGLIVRQKNKARAISLTESTRKDYCSLAGVLTRYRKDFAEATGGWDFESIRDIASKLHEESMELTCATESIGEDAIIRITNELCDVVIIGAVLLAEAGLNMDDMLHKRILCNLDRAKRAALAAKAKGSSISDEWKATTRTISE